MSLDPATFGVLVTAIALACVLIAILPVWRRVMGDGRPLPFRLFRRGTDIPIEGRAALLAEIRCEFCGERDACLERLKAGAAQPPADCPNSASFARAE